MSLIIGASIFQSLTTVMVANHCMSSVLTKITMCKASLSLFLSTKKHAECGTLSYESLLMSAFVGGCILLYHRGVLLMLMPIDSQYFAYQAYYLSCHFISQYMQKYSSDVLICSKSLQMSNTV